MLLRSIRDIGNAFESLARPEAHLSFSQFGEDLVAWSILETHKRLKNGFYVDVGAHDPWHCSNTALLWRYQEWSGMNIDANPESIERFRQTRPRDINVLAAIDEEERDLEYAMFDHPGVNTLDQAMRARQVATNGVFKLEKVVKVRTQRLDHVLESHLPPKKEIVLLSVDVEGFDLQVLKSNDWGRWRPFLVLVETHGMTLGSPDSNPVHCFLKEQGYKLVSHCFVTSFYLRTR